MLDEGHSGDLYAVLGVRADAEVAALRQAYTRAALRSHPDKNPGDAGAATRFARVNAAYEVLRDESRRGIYDAFGAVWKSTSELGSRRWRGAPEI